MDLITRRVIKELEGADNVPLEEYSDPSTAKHCCMVDKIREILGLTSLKYQELDDMLEAIGLPKDKICTYCWNGRE
jgi:amidophosphoribosyltransferase